MPGGVPELPGEVRGMLFSSLACPQCSKQRNPDEVTGDAVFTRSAIAPL